jgi:hypothetical protein
VKINQSRSEGKRLGSVACGQPYFYHDRLSMTGKVPSKGAEDQFGLIDLTTGEVTLGISQETIVYPVKAEINISSLIAE